MLVIFYGRSGSGKSTMERLLESRLGFSRMSSYTSRQPREGEIPGVDYHFTDKETLKKMYESGDLMELNEYQGNLYGVKAVSKDNNTAMVIEAKGIRQIKDYYGNVSEEQRPKIIVICLDCTRENAIKRCSNRLERVEQDDVIFKDATTQDIVDYVVSANEPIEDVYKVVSKIILNEQQEVV